MKILKKGSKGPDVEKLQTTLNKTGAKLEVDGKFGPATSEAVKKFQKKSGLKPDGVVGPNTSKAIESGGKPPKTDWPYDDFIAMQRKRHSATASTKADVKKATADLKKLPKSDDTTRLETSLKNLYPQWEQADLDATTSVDMLSKKQTEHKDLKSKPANAEKLVKLIEPDVKKHPTLKKKADDLVKQIESLLDEISELKGSPKQETPAKTDRRSKRDEEPEDTGTKRRRRPPPGRER